MRRSDFRRGVFDFHLFLKLSFFLDVAPFRRKRPAAVMDECTPAPGSTRGCEAARSHRGVMMCALQQVALHVIRARVIGLQGCGALRLFLVCFVPISDSADRRSSCAPAPLDRPAAVAFFPRLQLQVHHPPMVSLSFSAASAIKAGSPSDKTVTSFLLHHDGPLCSTKESPHASGPRREGNVERNKNEPV